MMNKDNPQKEENVKNKPSSKLKYFFIFIAACLALILILAAIIRSTQQQLSKKINENTQQTQLISSQLQELKQQQNQYQQWRKNERSNKTQNKLYDVLYKLQLANLYVELGKNAQARQLLMDSQSLLDTTNVTAAKALKQKIKVAIDQLGAFAKIDTNKTILTLDQINQTINALSVLNQRHLFKTPQQNVKPLTPSSQKTTTPNFWQSVLNQLKQLVIIHRVNDQAEGFFKENTLLIKQMVTQKILQMQQALLKNDLRLYQHDTDIVITWLKEYFSQDKNQLKLIIQKLQGLPAYTAPVSPQSVDLLELVTLATQTIQSSLDSDIKTQKEQSKTSQNPVKNLTDTPKSPQSSLTLPIKPAIEV